MPHNTWLSIACSPILHDLLHAHKVTPSSCHCELSSIPLDSDYSHESHLCVAPIICPRSAWAPTIWMCSTHSFALWCSFLMLPCSSLHLQPPHWRAHATQHWHGRTWIHQPIDTNGISLNVANRTSNLKPCPPCNRCRWHSILCNMPRYPSRNPGTWTQVLCVGVTNYRHLHMKSGCNKISKVKNLRTFTIQCYIPPIPCSHIPT